MNTLSIITPAYNAQAFIGQLIESIICQPIMVEHIIVNDGSSDNTKFVCEEYAKKYNNIRLINSENKGAGAARNIGIRAATGRYLIFVDSDDLLYSNVINDNFLLFLKSCDHKNIDIISTAIGSSDVNLINKPTIIQPQKIHEIKGSLPWLEFWSFIYRHDFITENHIDFFEYQEQDVESAFRYRTFSKTSRIVVAPQYSYYLRRVNPTSNMHTINYYKLYRIKAKVYAQLVDEAMSNNRPQEEAGRLQYTEIECIYCYLKYTWHHGRESSTDYKLHFNELKEIFRKRIKATIIYKSFSKLKTIGRYLYYILFIKSFLCFKKIDNVPIVQDVESVQEPLQLDADSIILERLSKWSLDKGINS